MSKRVCSAEFRQIENRSGPARADRLFRAAISAFAALRRPSRSEIVQLDDLALPLVGEVSRESRRFASAALADCPALPPLLVRHLVREDADIAAPLLVHSPALSDADLIVAIAARGIGHARIIARRPVLSATMEGLLAALHDAEIARLRQNAERTEAPARPVARTEATREWLRQMMRPMELPAFYRSLLEAALSSRPTIFEFRLADGTGIALEAARAICRAEDLTDLAMVLCARGFSAEQAFVLVAALRPGQFSDAALIRRFLEEFDALDPEACREILRGWRGSFRSQTQRPDDEAALQAEAEPSIM